MFDKLIIFFPSLHKKDSKLSSRYFPFENIEIFLVIFQESLKILYERFEKSRSLTILALDM